jgi:predicted nucleotidyltransferase
VTQFPGLSMKDSSDLALAVDILESYGAREIFLFGSMARGDVDDFSDRDFAIRGIPAEKFYSVLGKLLSSLARPVDLIDLAEDEHFTEHLGEKREFTRVA